MINYLLVSLGAAAGGALRYFISNSAYKMFNPIFPYGTLIVNIIGSFLVGIIIFVLDERKIISPEVRLLLTVGFCGGFTTFSTFSLETINLMKNAQFFFAFLNVMLNLFLCLGGVFLAYLVSKI